MNSFSLDRLVPEDGLEFADAFTLLGQPHLNLIAFMLEPPHRHVGNVLGCADGLVAAQHLQAQGQTQDARRGRP